MGNVPDALEESGLAGDTLVICTTDHRTPLPRMKCTLSDDGIGVYLIKCGPNGFSGGRVVDSLVSHIDIFPTLCEHLGLRAPSRFQGRSVMPVISGEVKEVNERIFAELTYHAACEPLRSTRTKRFKYIRRLDGRKRPVLSDVDGYSPSGRTSQI